MLGSAMIVLAAAWMAAPKPLPAPPANLPAASRYELDNGLRVILIENHAAPWLEVQLGFRIGTASDPKGKEGLASMTGRMLSAGVTGLDEQQLAEALARIGADVDVEADTDTFTISGHVLTMDAPDARRFMELFSSLALDATLPANLLERQKTMRIAELHHLVDAPDALADEAMRIVGLAGYAEARPTYGTLEALPTLTRDDVVRWRDRAFAPSQAVLVVAGAIDREAMLAWIDQRFGALGRGVTCERGDGVLPGHCSRLCKDGDCLDNPTAIARARRAPAKSDAPSVAPVVLVTIDQPMPQAQWRYGAVNPFPVTHPDWGAFRLGTHVLGGEFNSRLNDLLRVKHSLTYGAYFAAAFGGWDSGVMHITTDATLDALSTSIALGVGEYKRMAKELVPKQELEDTRSTLVNGFPFRFETVSDVASQYAFVELADIPWQWLATWTEAVGRYDAKAVKTAFEAAQAASPAHLVVVGPPGLEPALKKLGLGAVKVVPVDDFLARGL